MLRSPQPESGLPGSGVQSRTLALPRGEQARLQAARCESKLQLQPRPLILPGATPKNKRRRVTLRCKMSGNAYSVGLACRSSESFARSRTYLTLQTMLLAQSELCTGLLTHSASEPAQTVTQ